MRWLINYIRSCFCKHEWELIFDTTLTGCHLDGTPYEYPVGHIKTYRCKKCGIMKRYKNQ